MNVFALHQHPIAAAKMHCDKHVVKMILETAQLLSTAHRMLDGTLEKRDSVSGKTKTKYNNSDISQLIELFMDHEHNWRPRTREVYETCFKHFLNKGLPETQTYKAMVIRCLNRLQNWAFQEGFINRPRLIPGGNNYVQRSRVFNKIESLCVSC